ncbi:calcium release-activated calcium channel 1-like isoform X2 [Brachionus plicatilis]|uniref:Calcium release-activated calcium channel 1-like isoform X2 n=1 Tax=Brachionus plicatilis TaxID=10195 RepID=A0A3M7PK50_BRAPC|nr:calcium release-activated calcium channel 1-like isoform X2 [Brachionus plicatilis]
MIRPQKMSSFELNFLEKNNAKNLPSSNDLESLTSNKTSANIQMDPVEPKNVTFGLNNLKKSDQLISPTSISRFRPPNFGNYRSSMQLFNLKLSRSKLKAVTRTSALLSGFAMVAMVELSLDYNDYFEAIKQEHEKDLLAVNLSISQNAIKNEIQADKYLIPETMLVLYSLVTCLLVGVHMVALMISTCILPQLEASSDDQLEFERQFFRYEQNIRIQSSVLPQNGDTKINLCESQNDDTLFKKNHDENFLNESHIIFPYHKFHKFIETAWISSTVIGLFLFILEIGIVVYIKFYPISKIAAFTGAIVMTPILVLFIVFTVFFYRHVADFKLSTSKKIISQLEKHEHII